MTERSPLWAPSGGSPPDALPTARRPGFGVRVEVHAPRWEALRREIEDLCRDLGVSGNPEVPVYLHRPAGLKIDRYEQVLVAESDVERWALTVSTCATIVANPTISLAYQARTVLEVAGLLARPDQREYALRGMTLRQPWIGGNATEALTLQVALAHLAAHSDLPGVAAAMLGNAARSRGERWRDLHELSVARGQGIGAPAAIALCQRAVELCVDELGDRASFAERHLAQGTSPAGDTSDSPESTRRMELVFDEDLLRRYVEDDDRGAFAALVARHQDAIHALVRRLLPGGSPDADDICQQVFLDAFRNAGSFTRKQSVRNWLHGIAMHLVLDRARASSRLHRNITASERMEISVEPDAIDAIATSEMEHALERALQTLSPEARHAVLLRYEYGLSYDEMAALTGELHGTLQGRVARALPALRRAMESRGGNNAR